jgi:hypothetical protein
MTSGNPAPTRSRGDERPTFGRVGEAEVVRHRALLERLSQLISPTGPGLADDVHRVWRHPIRLGPLEQHHGYGLMELLVG